MGTNYLDLISSIEDSVILNQWEHDFIRDIKKKLIDGYELSTKQKIALGNIFSRSSNPNDLEDTYGPI